MIYGGMAINKNEVPYLTTENYYQHKILIFRITLNNISEWVMWRAKKQKWL